MPTLSACSRMRQEIPACLRQAPTASPAGPAPTTIVWPEARSGLESSFSTTYRPPWSRELRLESMSVAERIVDGHPEATEVGDIPCCDAKTLRLGDAENQ